MMHLVYILAFTIIAFLAISNLIRSLITVSMDSQRRYTGANRSARREFNSSRLPKTLHPELLDDSGKPINEPLLVMRSVTLEDARQQLDDLYHSSPSQPKEPEEET